MDATAGGRILEGMCTNKQESDAVKILHYMQERSVAKVLADPVRPVRELCKDAPPELVGIAQKCLQVSKESRYATSG
jgi:hypothetical protein